MANPFWSWRHRKRRTLESSIYRRLFNTKFILLATETTQTPTPGLQICGANILGLEVDPAVAATAHEIEMSGDAGLLWVNIHQIPTYLHESEFYLSINSTDDNCFSVPRNCVKEDYTVSTLDDLQCLLSTIRFWGLLTIPDTLIAYAQNNSAAVYSHVFDEFKSDLRYLSDLQGMQEAYSFRNKWDLAMESGELDNAQYLHEHDYLWCVESLGKAAALGHVHMLQYAFDNGCPWTEETQDEICAAAIANHHMSCLEYVLLHRCWKQSKYYGAPDLSVLAAKANNLAALQLLHKMKYPWTASACTAAAQCGSLACLTYAHVHGCDWDWSAFTAAALPYRPDILAYLRLNGCPWDEQLFQSAMWMKPFSAEYVDYLITNECPADSYCVNSLLADGHLLLAKTLLERGVPVDDQSIARAARSGNVRCLELVMSYGATWTPQACESAMVPKSPACLQYALANGCPPPTVKMVKHAVRRGALECIIYLHQQGCCPWDRDVFIEAVSPYQPDMVKYLFENGCPCDAFVLHVANCREQWDCCRYLISNGCPGDTDCLHNLAARGDYDSVKALLDQGVSADDSGFAYRNLAAAAAKGGNLKCLELVVSRGARWVEQVCTEAVEQDSIDCLSYARENGCPWSEKWSCDNAARQGAINCLKYLSKHGCRMSVSTTQAAALNGHLECLKFAHEYGCDWDVQVCANAALHGHLECLKYAREHGCPWDYKTCHNAAKGLHFECLSYAQANGCPLQPPAKTEGSA